MLALSMMLAAPMQSQAKVKHKHHAQMMKSEKTQLGMASFYAEKFHGRRTANGEVFNNHAMTAAHLKLPFGTQVKVTNLKNGKSVVVRINDRGPHVRGRIIDLTYAAAKKIGIIKAGAAKVKLEILS